MSDNNIENKFKTATEIQNLDHSDNVSKSKFINDLDIENKIIKTIVDTLKVEESTISLSSKLVDDLGADSLDLVELMMAIEAAFPGCDIPDEQASKIATVADAIKYVEQHLDKKAKGS